MAFPKEETIGYILSHIRNTNISPKIQNKKVLKEIRATNRVTIADKLEENFLNLKENLSILKGSHR